MKQVNYQELLLDLIDRPVFCVKNGSIIHVNHAAQKMQITPGTQITQLIPSDLEPYKDLQDGCLFLTIMVANIPCSATVMRTSECDVFVLEQTSDDACLQAMSLAAQQLRAPLSNVMIVADGLLSGAALNESSETRNQVGQINKGLFQLLRIISNMADSQRYTNPESLRMEPVDLNAFLCEILAKAQALLPRTNVKLKYTGLKNPLFSRVSPEALERAVYNLISNAVKFSHHGGTVEAKLVQHGSMLHFTIQNEGSGIEPHVAGNIFSRYRRQPGIEDSRHGLGLGMALARSVAAAHGGTILIDQPQENITRVTMTMAIRTGDMDTVHSPVFRLSDYAGGWDHGLLELSQMLSSNLYDNDH